MDKNLIRLRKLATKHSRGSPGARDSMIVQFLGEISQVVCQQVIDDADDDVLWMMHATWIGLVMEGCDEGQRVEAMAKGVTLMPFSCKSTPAQDLPSNVKKLFG